MSQTHYTSLEGRRTGRHRRRRAGISLLEVAAVSFIVGGTLVPTLALLHETYHHAREVDLRNDIVAMGVSKLEEHCGITNNSFAKLPPVP